jgi:two-component system cell cycle response regulator
MTGRVLIIDGQASNRIVLKARLAAACYDPLAAADADSALALVRDAGPDAILIDLDLPGPAGGVGLVQRLRADLRLSTVPLVALGAPQDSEGRIAALQAGADDVMAKPVDDLALLARLRNLLRRREVLRDLAGGIDSVRDLGLAEAADTFDRPGLVALVTARPETAMRLRRDLSPLLPDRLISLTPAEALADGGGPAPDIFVIEGQPSGDAGSLRLMSDLRSRGPARHSSFCLLRPASAAGEDAMAFDLGAHDLAETGGDPRELALRLAGLLRCKRMSDNLRATVRDGLRMAVIDPLTGLHNRRYALNQLAGIAEAARVEGESFAVMVVDLDRFKTVNDRWGHAAGDAVLVEVAHRLADNLRAGDLLARIGGEEFLIALPGVALPGAALAEARRVAERLCNAIKDRPIALPRGGSVAITTSIGLAVSEGGAPLQREAVQCLIERADRALLSSKSSGRNQVTVDRNAA